MTFKEWLYIKNKKEVINMTLKEWLEVVDAVGLNVRLWSQYCTDNNPVWEGWSRDVPWVYIDKKIGIVNEDTGVIEKEDAIYFITEKNEYGSNIVWANINIVE